MRWYIRLAAALTAVAVLAGAVLTISSLTDTLFEPSAVCTGKESYAVAQHSSGDKWQITILGRKGERKKRYKIRTNNKISSKVKLTYDNDSYYFWDIADTRDKNDRNKADKEEENGQTLKVYQITGGKRKLSKKKFSFSSNEQLYGMHVYQDTMSVVSSQVVKGNKTKFTVYTSRMDEEVINKPYSVTLLMPYIRDAVFCSDGMLYILSSAGRIYTCSEGKRLYCLDNRTGYYKICNDQNDIPYFLNEDGTISCLAGPYQLKPVMKNFTAEFSENSDQCTDMDILSEKDASVIYEKDEGQWCAQLFHNEKNVCVEQIADYLRWQKVLLFIGILILYATAAFLLWIAVLKCLSDDASLKYRMAFVCLTSACIAITGITVGLSKLYDRQKGEQSWEKMVILLHYAEVYLDPASHEELMLLEQKDSDALAQMKDESGFMTELRNYISSNHKQGNQYLLIVPDKNNKLYVIAGTDDMIGRPLVQICGKESIQQLEKLYNAETDSVNGYETRCGEKWMYIAKRFGNSDNSVRGILLMRSPDSKIEGKSIRILLAIGVLYLMILLYITLLHCRFCKVIRPLSEIEQQANSVMLQGSFEAEPVTGRNEITLLSIRFRNAVNELIDGMEKSRLSAESYARFMNHDWTKLIGKENLYQIHAGERANCQAAVLEMRMKPRVGCKMKYGQMYEKLLDVVRSNNGVPESLNPERMRFLFPQGSMSAICAASVIREVTSQDFEMAATIDYGMVEILVLGDERQSRIHSFLHGKTNIFTVMRRVCTEYGCAVLVTDSAVQAIEHFHEIFNSRFIGFFMLSGERATQLRLVEILEQKNSSTFEDAVGKYYSGEYVQAFAEFCHVLERDPDDRAAEHYLELCHRALHVEGK